MVLFAAKLEREGQAVDMFERLKSALVTSRPRTVLDLIEETRDHLLVSKDKGSGYYYDLAQVDRIGRIVAFQSGLSFEEMIEPDRYFRTPSSKVRYLKAANRYLVRIKTGIRPSRGATTAEILEQLSFIDPPIAAYLGETEGFMRYRGRCKNTLKFEYIGPILVYYGPLENLSCSSYDFPSPGTVPRKTIAHMFDRNGYFFPGEDSQGRS